MIITTSTSLSDVGKIGLQNHLIYAYRHYDTIACTNPNAVGKFSGIILNSKTFGQETTVLVLFQIKLMCYHDCLLMEENVEQTIHLRCAM